MHRTIALAGLLLAVIGAGCTPGAGQSPGPGSSSEQPSGFSDAPSSDAPDATGSPVGRPELPPGFPVLPGATTAEPEDDDPGLIAVWTADQVGIGVYDFYVDALPAAGYPIDGLFPGDWLAVVRFVGPGGALWQLVLASDDLVTTRIEVRLDRP